MTLTRPRRRGAALAAALLSAALVLTACGSGGTSGNDNTPQNSSGSEGYPVTVGTPFGDITLDKKPERIVAIDVSSIDMLTAIDVQPTAVNALSPSDEDEAISYTPWLKGTYTGEYDPKMVSGEYKVVAEAVAAHQPDLIVWVPVAEIDKEQYELLSTIAPTYTPALPADREWKDVFKDVGALTGKVKEVEAEIADAENELATARQSLPGLEGATLNIGFSLGESGVKLTTESWYQDLGIVPANSQPTKAEGSTVISAENIDLLSGDILVLLANEEVQADFLKDPRVADLPASKNGALIFIDEGISNASTRQGPQALTYLLQRIVPLLEQTDLNKAGE